jgi:uncharacterized protein (TIGR00369 family)
MNAIVLSRPIWPSSRIKTKDYFMADSRNYDLTSLEGLQSLIETTPIHRWLGFRVSAFDAVVGSLTMVCPADGNAARFDGAGQAHGGAIATLVDSTATFCCSAMLGKTVPTMNIRVDYLRPAGGTDLTATARVVRAGRTVALVDVEVHSGDKLVAVGRCGQASGA